MLVYLRQWLPSFAMDMWTCGQWVLPVRHAWVQMKFRPFIKHQYVIRQCLISGELWSTTTKSSHLRLGNLCPQVDPSQLFSFTSTLFVFSSFNPNQLQHNTFCHCHGVFSDNAFLEIEILPIEARRCEFVGLPCFFTGFQNILFEKLNQWRLLPTI